MLGVKMQHIERWTQRRREIAQFYNQAFRNVPAIETPNESGWAEAVYHLYVVQVDQRDAVKQKLNEAGVGAAIHYPRPLHLQKSYAFLGHGPGSFPVSERAGERVLSLPNYPEMTEEMLALVVEAAKNAVGT